jgi:hypothetical protein
MRRKARTTFAAGPAALNGAPTESDGGVGPSGSKTFDQIAGSVHASSRPRGAISCPDSVLVVSTLAPLVLSSDGMVYLEIPCFHRTAHRVRVAGVQPPPKPLGDSIPSRIRAE